MTNQRVFEGQVHAENLQRQLAEAERENAKLLEAAAIQQKTKTKVCKCDQQIKSGMRSVTSMTHALEERKRELAEQVGHAGRDAEGRAIMGRDPLTQH